MIDLRAPSVLLALLLCAAPPGPAAAQGDELKAPPPEWAETLPLEPDRPFDRSSTQQGTHYHLVEVQSNQAEGARYRRVVYRLLNAEGVRENSSLSFDFDPEKSVFALNRLVVHRDGEELDRLESQEVRLLQRESSLERNLYDGRYSAHLLLEDIRVGDLVDYAYTITNRPDAFDRRFFSVLPLQYSTPVGRYLVRHLAAPDQPFHHRVHDSDLSAEVLPRGPLREHRWYQEDVPASRRESNTPLWHFDYPVLEKSEFGAWEEVVAWGLERYDLDQELPEEAARAAEAWRSLPDEERIAEALRYVQREVRYVAMALGPHSYMPYPPEQVMRRKFGDCKDKSLLLVLLLRHLGFENAWPALVETDYGPVLERSLPSPLAFDHVVVHLDHGGEEHWFEATASEQFGPLRQILFPDYGQALVLRPGETGLRRVRPRGYEESSQSIEEHIRVRCYGEPAELTVATRYFGSEADSIRRRFDGNAVSDISEQYLSFYRDTYAGIRETAPPEFEDDPAANVVTVRESYEIDDLFTPGEGAGGAYGAFFNASLVDAHLARPGPQPRTMPYELALPSTIVQEIVITLPEGDAWFEDERSEIVNSAFRYAYEATFNGGTDLKLRHEYRNLRDHVAADEFAAYADEIEKVYQNTGYSVTIPAAYLAGGAGGSAGEGEGSGPPDPLRVFAAATAFLFGSIVAVLAVAVPPGRRRRERLARQTAEGGPEGLGGWLVLVAIYVVISPLLLLWGLADSASSLGKGATFHTTDPAGDHYHPLWAVAITVEYSLMAFSLPLAAAALFLFFGKRWTFPWVWMLLLVVNLVDHASTGVLALFIGSELLGTMERIAGGVLGATLGAAVWISYLLLSRRVRNTFVRFPGQRRSAPPPLPVAPPPLPTCRV